MVERPDALVQGLTLLSDALDDPLTDLEAVLAVLTDDLAAAVPRYLGLTVTLHVDDSTVIVNTLDDGETSIHATVLLPLLPLRGSTTTGSVIFYSGAPDAFVQLADDARWIFNLDGYPVLDSHLALNGGHTEAPNIHGLSEFSDIHQAIGVLVEDGRTVDEARAELRSRATADGLRLHEFARQLLKAIPGSVPPADAAPDPPAARD